MTKLIKKNPEVAVTIGWFVLIIIIAIQLV